MHLIPHRGNTHGRIPERENSPDYLQEAIDKGYSVEVDVWYTEAKELYLGHDGPQYATTIDFLKNEYFWCHCKNIEALKYLLEEGAHCFYHKSDDVTLTSEGYMWVFPNKKLVKGSVCVLPEYGLHGKIEDCVGICSDFIERYK